MKRFLIFLLLVGSQNVFGQGYLNFPLDTLALDSFYNYRAQIKYDANGNYNIVNTRQFHTASETRDIFFWTDRSGTIEKIRVTNNNIDDNYAIVDFDWQNNVHIGWERRDGSNLFQVIYANERQTTGDFSNTVWITSGGLNKATPHMAVGTDSIAHFVYMTFVTGQDNAYYRTYNFITSQLGPEITLGPAEASGENDIEAAVDNLNNVHITYTTNTNFNGGALMYFTNEGGSLVSIPTGLSANVSYPDITIDNNNTVYIVYRLSTDNRLYVISRPIGGSFTAPVAIVPPGVGLPAFWRSIDTDDVGNLYVTYANNNSSGPKGVFLVYGQGTVFNGPFLVYQDSAGAYLSMGSTSVTAKNHGEVAISFTPAASRFGNVVSDLFVKEGIMALVGIEDPVSHPDKFILRDNYPNPFNPSTSIGYVLPWGSNVRLTVYDISGKAIKTIVDKFEHAGEYSVTFDASGLTTGVYFYKLETDEFTETKKMLLVK